MRTTSLCISHTLLITALLFPSLCYAGKVSAIELPSFPNPAPMTGEAVLFAFDELSFQPSESVEMQLIVGTPLDKFCVEPGPPGSHDERVCYYGSVVRVGEKDFRMWYLGVNDNKGWNGKRGCWHFCYATSKNGVNWTKPELGLVEFEGSKANNIVDFPIGPYDIHEPVVVLYDPEDPNPERRFKMLFEHYPSPLWGTAASPDGLRWKLLTNEKLKPWFEMSGVTRYRGRYYVAGQGGFPQPGPDSRRMGIFVSDDFVKWEFAGIGLDRCPKSQPPNSQNLYYPQIHLGAGLCNRGNVILGVYGKWNGVPKDKDPKTGNMLGDLGLAISHDAVHFSEPIPDFAFIEEKIQKRPYTDVSRDYARVLMQGQGMYNVGDRTLFWYAYWGGPQVRAASWKRDRLGYLASTGKPAKVTSCPIKVVDGKEKVFINAETGTDGELSVTILGQNGKPVPGFGPVKVTGNHLHKQIVWKGGNLLNPKLGTVRVQISGKGDWKLYALYIGEGEPKFLEKK